MPVDPFTIASLAMAGTELVRGITGNQQAKKMRKEYDAAERAIPMQDPAQLALLGETRRRMNSLRQGADQMTAYGMQQARESLVNTQGNVVRSGRGNLSDLLKAQRNSDLGVSAITAQGNQRADALMPMEGQLVGAMAQRAYDRQLSNANRLWSEYTRKREDSNRQIMAGIGMLPNIAMGFGKGAPKSGAPSTATMTQQINASLPAGRAMSSGGNVPAGMGVGMFPGMANTAPAQPQFGGQPFWATQPLSWYQQ